MKWVVSLLALVLSGCAANFPTIPELADVEIDVLRLTQANDRVTLETFEFFPPGSEVIYYFEARFRILGPSQYATTEIVLPIVVGSEGPLFETDHFTLRVPAYVAEGKRQATWTDNAGLHQTAARFPFAFSKIARKKGTPDI